MIDKNTKYLKCDAQLDDVGQGPLYINFDSIKGFVMEGENRIRISVGPGQIIIEFDKNAGIITSPENPYVYSPPALNMCAEALNKLFDEVNTFSPKAVYELPTFYGYDAAQLKQIREDKERETTRMQKEIDKEIDKERNALQFNEEREVTRAEDQGKSPGEIDLIKLRYKTLIDNMEQELQSQANQEMRDLINADCNLRKVLMTITNIIYEENL